jgi:hypothetical protein
MRGERGLKSWIHSGSLSRYIDRYNKLDALSIKKIKERKRKKIDSGLVAEELLELIDRK